jgi:hypothetical protein
MGLCRASLVLPLTVKACRVALKTLSFRHHRKS